MSMAALRTLRRGNEKTNLSGFYSDGIEWMRNDSKV